MKKLLLSGVIACLVLGALTLLGCPKPPPEPSMTAAPEAPKAAAAPKAGEASMSMGSTPAQQEHVDYAPPPLKGKTGWGAPGEGDSGATEGGSQGSESTEGKGPEESAETKTSEGESNPTAIEMGAK